jgi:hypothetical protein
MATLAAATCDLFVDRADRFYFKKLANAYNSWAPPPERVGTRESHRKLGFKRVFIFKFL